MTNKYDRDRRMIAYLFAIAAIAIAAFFTITQPTLLGYGPMLAIGGFVTAALLLLGVNPNPRGGSDERQRDPDPGRDNGYPTGNDVAQRGSNDHQGSDSSVRRGGLRLHGLRLVGSHRHHQGTAA